MASTHVGRGTMRALISIAVALGANGAAVADDDGETPSAEELLAQAQSLAEQGQHADALRTLMTMLEAYPDGLDHDAYDRVRRTSAEWFSRVPSADRAGNCWPAPPVFYPPTTPASPVRSAHHPP